MMTLVTSNIQEKRRLRKGLWFERVMAMIALANYILVLLDLSYIPFRNFYLKYFPQITVWYGETFKGIEPERFTVDYLETAKELNSLVAEYSLNSPEVEEQLQELQMLSVVMINDNPFEIANKTGTLEQIKAQMRERVGVDSSTEAFETFWNVEYLRQAGWSDSWQFFQTEIQPLMETNYYRKLDITGRPVDLFWVIDQPFVIIFGVEFLLRTFYLSRRYKGTSWIQTMVWRWYDVLLLLPFWRWLRCIPVSIRLAQADIFNVMVLVRRLRRDAIANFATELTEIVVIQVIDQAEAVIEDGSVARWLTTSNRYVDINGIDEVGLIAKRLNTVLVEDVLPAVKPELDALISHSVGNVLHSVPLYSGVTWLPGAKEASNRLTQNLVETTTQNIYGALQSALKDDQGGALTQALIQSFLENLRTGMRQQDTLNELQYLLVALLDEVKVNFVQRIEASDIVDMDAKTKRIYELTNKVGTGNSPMQAVRDRPS
ncbi:MAG: hypothetical protein IGR76_16710 [Synechococcales cyanobacterium T60_A2020_003]|nr:hypothetical protein [Synechococcales cyanobacterium T60_A2020_003]